MESWEVDSMSSLRDILRFIGATKVKTEDDISLSELINNSSRLVAPNSIARSLASTVKTWKLKTTGQTSSSDLLLEAYNFSDVEGEGNFTKYLEIERKLQTFYRPYNLLLYKLMLALEKTEFLQSNGTCWWTD